MRKAKKRAKRAKKRSRAAKAGPKAEAAQKAPPGPARRARKPIPRPGLKTRRELAELMGLNMDTVTRWERAGMPIVERGGRGRPSFYDPEAVRAWLKERDAAARASTNGPLDPTQEKARRERWQAMVARQTYLMRKRALLPAEEVEREEAARVAAARAKLLQVPTAYADGLHRTALVEGAAGLEKALRKMVNEVLAELARRPDPEGAAPAEDPEEDAA